MNNWLKPIGKVEDIVLSSRIRLARNIKNTPFPHKLNEEEGKTVVNTIEKAMGNFSKNEDSFKKFYLWNLTQLESRSYFEKHLISYKLLSNYDKAAFILDKDETISLLINEEDHIRIQCITSGFNLEEAYEMANKVDNFMEEKIDYAFDEKLGYLTACPTNIGTGMRASVMVHLPALSMSNEIAEVLKAVSQVGMTIRGLYGEGSKASGNLYQISNQITLGVTEDEIINNLNAVINQIINEENISRKKLLANYPYEVEDKIARAIGVLKSAIILDVNECLNLLSYVRLGVELEIIKDINKEILNNLIVDIQPASLQIINNKKSNEKEKNYLRAKLVRDRLKSL